MKILRIAIGQPSAEGFKKSRSYWQQAFHKRKLELTAVAKAILAAGERNSVRIP
jgi:ribosomal protein S10